MFVVCRHIIYSGLSIIISNSHTANIVIRIAVCTASFAWNEKLFSIPWDTSFWMKVPYVLFTSWKVPYTLFTGWKVPYILLLNVWEHENTLNEWRYSSTTGAP